MQSFGVAGSGPVGDGRVGRWRSGWVVHAVVSPGLRDGDRGGACGESWVQAGVVGRGPAGHVEEVVGDFGEVEGEADGVGDPGCEVAEGEVVIEIEFEAVFDGGVDLAAELFDARRVGVAREGVEVFAERDAAGVTVVDPGRAGAGGGGGADSGDDAVFGGEDAGDGAGGAGEIERVRRVRAACRAGGRGVPAGSLRCAWGAGVARRLARRIGNIFLGGEARSFVG